MQLKFKSEEHRQGFANIAACNQWIANMLGMDTWDCQIGDPDDDRSSIIVLDGFGDHLEGVFTSKDGNRYPDYAWIFYGEREYFDIDY